MLVGGRCTTAGDAKGRPEEMQNSGGPLKMLKMEVIIGWRDCVELSEVSQVNKSNFVLGRKISFVKKRKEGGEGRIFC